MHGSRFQSTLPAREATLFRLFRVIITAISIHASREGSDLTEDGADDAIVSISIHASREGSDRVFFCKRSVKAGISIHASREGSDGRTRCRLLRAAAISIHASREGSDAHGPRSLQSLTHFNPRFPRGKRQKLATLDSEYSQFQSTLPAREATSANPSTYIGGTWISIHASREGSDDALPPAPLQVQAISIHASREGSDTG